MLMTEGNRESDWRSEGLSLVSAFRMATLKEPPEASYKPPPKSKWSVPPAAPKCPACGKGSDNDRNMKSFVLTLLSELLPPQELNLSCWASDGFRQDSIPQGLRPLQTLQGSQPGDKGVLYKFRFCCQTIFDVLLLYFDSSVKSEKFDSFHFDWA